ncbi:MAG: glutathione S-transferase C-terminal domain-containing protein [Planctomycetes bacterium]|nr:glutathione S-transferase C-terminal domain-containing protein [Planctomycetota bacterium]
MGLGERRAHPRERRRGHHEVPEPVRRSQPDALHARQIGSLHRGTMRCSGGFVADLAVARRPRQRRFSWAARVLRRSLCACEPFRAGECAVACYRAPPTQPPPANMAAQATLDRLFAEFDSPPEVIASIVALLEDQASPAFIARYRREATGGLGEDRIHAIAERWHALDEIEQRLARGRYLVGERLTEADIRLFTTLVRFDAVYYGHFKCNLRQIRDYENLSNYLRDIYQLPGIAETVNMLHIKQHYYASHETVNPTRIVPKGPELDFDLPHDRDRFRRAA